MKKADKKWLKEMNEVLTSAIKRGFKVCSVTSVYTDETHKDIYYIKIKFKRE